MITYSRKEMQRELVADQALWARLPSALGDMLWPTEIVLLGWAIGWWTGILTVAALGVGSILLPPRLPISVYLVDLLDRLARLPLAIVWLLLVWHLVQREPIFSPLGYTFPGALLVAAMLCIATRPIAYISRFGARRVAARLPSRAHE